MVTFSGLFLLITYVNISLMTLMRRNWLIVAVIVLALILVGLVVRAKFFAKPGLGALQVSSTPKATVFIDGNQVGTTPFFDDKITPGEHTVKLVPEINKDELVSWEGKVNFAPGIVTAINRVLGKTEAESSGEILALEKIAARDTASLAVVSIPDQAVVKINEEPKGFTPVLAERLTPGEYRVTISSPGFEEKVITAQTVAGYKLTVNVKLAQKIEGIAEATPSGELEEEEEAKTSPSPKESPKPSPTPPPKPYVLIKDTPTGWLRVRMGPSTSATEAAKVNPGEMFPYLNEEENGWYKIEYEKGEEGWVSGTYAELVE